MHKVDPPTGKITQRAKVPFRREPACLEAAHLARRSRKALRCLAADDPAHCRIVAQTFARFLHAVRSPLPAALDTITGRMLTFSERDQVDVKMNDEPNSSADGNKRTNEYHRRARETTDAHSTKKQHDWYDISHLVILAVTFAAAILAAVFAGWLAWRTNDIASDGNKQLIAATRAWLVPTGAYFDGEPKAGFNQRIKVTYENSGREAAVDAVNILGWSGRTFPVTIDAKQMPYIDIQTASWPPNNALCNVDPSEIVNRRAVYPSSKNQTIKHIFNDGPNYLPQGVIDGTEFFYVFGCIGYRSPITGAQIHHSPYCLYYQPKRGGTINDATFEFCPSGSVNAD